MTLQQVHLRINDAATGQPTPVRLRITDNDGRYYAPYGRLTEFATGVNQDVGGNVQIGAKKWAYIDGTCEILLPPGKLHIEISKGPEYKPIDEETTLLAGKMSMRFTIERWCDMRKEGWYSGDTRVHFMSPDAALLEGQAEDLAVVNLLATEHERAFTNIISFSGQAFSRSAGGCGVAVNTLNRARGLGQLGLLHCHRVVYPLTVDCDSDGSWILADWCGQCHRKNGLVVWTNPSLGGTDACCDEALADLILGDIDAIEWTEMDFTGLSNDYYFLCDAGQFASPVGGSGKCSNVGQLGFPRTYAFLPETTDFTYTDWIEAIRAGRTFITNGPIVQIIIDGVVPNSRLEVSADKADLEISVYAKGDTRFDRVELLWNGEIVASATPDQFPHHVEIYHELPVHTSGWLAARCVTDRTHDSGPLPFAHTSAVAVHVDGVRPHPKPEAAARVMRELDNLLNVANKLPRGQRLAHVVEEARTKFAKRLSSG